jgi:mannose-6-phosphate isomerase-like protein (cupin superfamily)
MRILFVAATLSLLALPAFAQAAAPVPYASPVDVAAAEAKARSLPIMTPQPLVNTPPYGAVIEWRGKPTPASVHEKDDELVNIVGGSGTMIVGGALKDQTRRNPTNLSGTGIEGGKTYELIKGTWLMIPAGTAHYFASMGSDGLTIMSMHMPHIAP